MVKTKTEEFWVLVKVVKYSGVYHFVTPENKTSFEILDAKRYPSKNFVMGNLPEVEKIVGWVAPKYIVLTTSYQVSEAPK